MPNENKEINYWRHDEMGASTRMIVTDADRERINAKWKPRQMTDAEYAEWVDKCNNQIIDDGDYR